MYTIHTEHTLLFRHTFIPDIFDLVTYKIYHGTNTNGWNTKVRHIIVFAIVGGNNWSYNL